MVEDNRGTYSFGETLLRLMLEEVPAIVWSTDGELRLTALLGSGPTARKLRSGQVVGTTLFQFFQTEDPRFPAIAAHHRALQGESVCYEQDWAGCAYHVRADPLRDETGRIIGCIGLAQDVDGRKQVEQALREAQAQLERRVADRTSSLVQANRQLRREIKDRKEAEETLQKEKRYLGYLLESQERDHQLIAYEIHDGLVQQIAGAAMQLETFSRLHERKVKEVWKTFEAGLAMLSEGLKEARRLIGGLRSPVLDEFGVVAAIEELVSQRSGQGKPKIDFVHRVTSDRMAPSLENAIFRIVQEGLTNAERHSQSDRVQIRLTQQDSHVRIEVKDWGVGFNPKAVVDGRFGLEGIQERARVFGGYAVIRSRPGKGTSILVELPVVSEGERLPANEFTPW